MSAPIPKTKAAELLNTLGEISRSGLGITEFQAGKYAREINAIIQTSVNLADAWMCQGVLYSLTFRPQEMLSAYENAKHFGATDSVSQFNQAVDYALYGYFEEAAKGYALSTDEKAQVSMLAIAAATLKFEMIEPLISSKFKSNLKSLKQLVGNLGINPDSGQHLMEVFFNSMRARKLGFWLTQHSFNLEGGEYALFFEASTDADTIMEVLNEFDSHVAKDDELLEISQKINIILIPFHGTEEVAA